MPHSRFIYFFLFILTTCLHADPTYAAVSVNQLYSDHMVLQRDALVRIQGMGTVDSTITIVFAGQSKQCVVGEDGSWQTQLDPMPASAEGSTMTISDEDSAIEIQDVVIGEVWYTIGGYHMVVDYGYLEERYPGLYAEHFAPRIDTGSIEGVRYFKIASHALEDISEPRSTFRVTHAAGFWGLSDNADRIRDQNPVIQQFAMDLYASLGVPVGIIHGANNQTSLETWSAQEALAAFPEWNQYYGPGFYPSSFANWMIHPGAGYTIRGMIIWQGDWNAAKLARSLVHRDLYPQTIKAYRKLWGQGDFPVLHVALGRSTGSSSSPARETKGFLAVREALIEAPLVIKENYATIAQDLFSENGFQPPNHYAMGSRLALLARDKVYGESGVQSQGPRYRSMNIVGGSAHIMFDNAAGGLAGADGSDDLPEKSFAIRGLNAEGQEVLEWAQARIDGETVVASHEAIVTPLAVQYAWTNDAQATLFNQHGLPAYPFRTDKDWSFTVVDPLWGALDSEGADGWTRPRWLGWTYVGDFPWVWNETTGWMYMAAESFTSISFYSPDADSWSWTSNAVFPAYYNFAAGDWGAFE